MLGIGVTPATAATYYVSPTGSDSNSGSSTAPWRTLQKAANTMNPGDTTLIANGTYPGGITQTRDGTASARITFRAINVGGVVIAGDQTTATDAFYINQANYVVVDGLTVQRGRRAGIRVSLSNGVTIRRCRLISNSRWGIFTDYSDDLLLESNECAFSGTEHGIYVSNSGDRPIIRFNSLHDNTCAGVQINADPGLLNPSLGSRGDGITVGALVDRNIIYNNGSGGAAGINLASVRSSRIVNNLVFNNRAGGIAGWDDGYGNQWGSKNNVIVHNTVYFRPGEGRWCLSLKNGSTGNVVQNNILNGGARGAIEIDRDSSVSSNYNLLRRAGSTGIATNEDTGAVYTLASWRSATGQDTQSIDADPLFVSPGSNFHLRVGSPAINTGANRTDVTVDLDGRGRPIGGRWDMGCYEQ
jgi:parallel beta-helix repeat protein